MREQLAVEDLGNVLGVWAHPDDEAYLSAGLMAEARDAGNRVVVATATYGEQGTADPESWTPDRLAAIRRHELAASLAALGVREHHWLGYADGRCADVPAEEGVAAVGKLIAEVDPDTIVTFGPEGMTGHSDHQTISAWTTAAWHAAGQRARLLYATLTPEYHDEWGEWNQRLGVWMSGSGPVTPREELAVLICCTGAALDRKLVALRAQASQTAGLIAEFGEDNYRRWCAEEAFCVAAQAMLA